MPENTQMVRIYYLTDESIDLLTDGLLELEELKKNQSSEPGDENSNLAVRYARLGRVLSVQQGKHEPVPGTEG